MTLKFQFWLISFAVACSLCVKAQTFTVLKTFNATQTNQYGTYTNSEGANPNAGLTQSGNTLFGTTYQGGTNGWGTIFKIYIDGTGFTVLKTFTGQSDGGWPSPGLTLSGGLLYGTTSVGGATGKGTVFRTATDGSAFTVLKAFTNSPDGARPLGNLVLSGNTLYGVTQMGGSYPYGGLGTVFKINTNGSGYAVLKSFTNSPDGSDPFAGLAIFGSTLFGTTYEGGTNTFGTVFKINSDATGSAVIHNFRTFSTDGSRPQSSLMLWGGSFYGTTTIGGNGNGGTIFKINPDGTGYSVIFNVQSGAYISPYIGTINAGTIYGISEPDSFDWRIFKINTDGSGKLVLKTSNQLSQNQFGIYTNSDGAYLNGALSLSGSLVLSGNTLYGTAYSGGNSGYGTVFSLNLSPSINIQPQSINTNQLTLQIVGIPNQSYILQSATNLTSPVNWQPVLTNPADGNGNWQFTDTNLNGSQKFYRAVGQ